MTHLRTTIVVAVAVAVAAVAAGAHASTRGFPGKDGRIVFNDQQGYLVLVNPDGTGLVRLAQTRTADQLIGASFSPDGARIAYSRVSNRGDADIYTISPDGSGQREVTFSQGTDVDPTWSGDGTRIAFETDRNGNVDIYSVNADGSRPVRLTSPDLDELDPAWSPPGQDRLHDGVRRRIESPDLGDERRRQREDTADERRQLQREPKLVARRQVDCLRVRPCGEREPRRVQDARRREPGDAAHRLARTRRTAGVCARWAQDRLRQ